MALRSATSSLSILILLLSVFSASSERDGIDKIAGAAIRADGSLQEVVVHSKSHSSVYDVAVAATPENDVADVDKGKIAAVFVSGMESIMEAVVTFVEDPDASRDEGQGSLSPSLQRGLGLICSGVWKMIQLVTPAEYHTSEQMVAVHSQLTSAYVHMPNLSADVNLFRRQGDVVALTRVIMSVLAVSVEASPHPKMSTVIGCLGDLMLGVGRGWELQTEGRVDLALQAVWQGLSVCFNAVDPQNWQIDVMRVDAAISSLSTQVLSYRRKTLLSKVCYKKAHIRSKKRPTLCNEGWDFDGHMYCLPQPKTTDSCRDHCGGEVGMCSTYCGEGLACCTPTGDDHPACAGAQGFKPDAPHAQCVKPGPSVVFMISNAGELLLRGYWLNTSSVVNGHPAYRHNTHVPGVTLHMQWSEENEQWEIFKDTMSGHHVFYSSALHTHTFPFSGWQVVAASYPEPQIRAFPFGKEFSAAEAALIQPSLRQPAGAQIANCEPGWIRSQLWCWGECPHGYEKKLEWCEQACEHTAFPVSSDGVCGTSKQELMHVMPAMQMMGVNSRYHASAISTELQQANMDTLKLSATLDCFIDQGQQFAHPFCPEGDQAAAHAAS